MSTIHEMNVSSEIEFHETYAMLVTYLCIITCFMIPIGMYICCEWDINTQSGKLVKYFSRLGIFYICVMLLCAFLKISYGVFHVVEFNSGAIGVSCLSSNCCEIYHGCSRGNKDTISYDIYIFEWNSGETCPWLSYMATQYEEDKNCEESEFGCCPMQITCDEYVRRGAPYSMYEQHMNTQTVMTQVKKQDSNGTGCPTDVSLAEKFVNHSYTEDTHRSVWMIICIICLLSIPCLTYNTEVVTFMTDTYNTSVVKIKDMYHGLKNKGVSPTEIPSEEEDDETRGMCENHLRLELVEDHEDSSELP